jgi:glucose-specific phosphotransferase system IIA component
MFGIFKKKSIEIKAPVIGKVVEIQSVPDEVFANKLAGDGVAIIPSSGDFVAPIDGVVSKIFDTNHAYIIKGDNGMEVMVHIGIDTVSLNSQGFERVVEPDSHVNAGDLIIKADLNYIKDNATDIITPVVIPEQNYKNIKQFYGDMTTDSTIMHLS